MSASLAKFERLSRRWGEWIGHTLKRERERILSAERDCKEGERIGKAMRDPLVRRHTLGRIQRQRLHLRIARREFNSALIDAEVTSIKPFPVNVRIAPRALYRHQQTSDRRAEDRRAASVIAKRRELSERLQWATGRASVLDSPRVVRIDPAVFGGGGSLWA